MRRSGEHAASENSGTPCPVIAKGHPVQMYVGDAWTMWRVAHIQPVHGGKRMAMVTLLREELPHAMEAQYPQV